MLKILMILIFSLNIALAGVTRFTSSEQQTFFTEADKAVSSLKNSGKRKTRSDKVLEPKCKHCEYKTNNLTCMKVHCLTHHSNKEERKKEFKYYCDKCDFGTYAEILFTRHCETKKHLQCE